MPETCSGEPWLTYKKEELFTVNGDHSKPLHIYNFNLQDAPVQVDSSQSVYSKYCLKNFESILNLVLLQESVPGVSSDKPVLLYILCMCVCS